MGKPVFANNAIIKDFSGKIECLAYYSHRILVGTQDGRLILHDTRRTQVGPVASMNFEHRRAIQQLIVVPHIRLVLVLSDGKMSVHSATDLEESEGDFRTVNNAKYFCVNQRGHPHYRVCVIMRKKFLMFEYGRKDKSESKKYGPLRNFDLHDTPERVAWYRNKLCIGFKKEFRIMNDKTGEDIAVSGVSPAAVRSSPLVKLLPKEQILVSTMDSLGITIDFGGNTFEKPPLKWSNSPKEIAYCGGYLVSLIPNFGIEVHAIKDHALVQSLPMSKATHIVGNGMKWDMEEREVGDAENVVLVATSSPSTVYQLECMQGGNIDQDCVEEEKMDQNVRKRAASKASTDAKHSSPNRFELSLKQLKHLDFKAATDSCIRAELNPSELLVYFPEFVGKGFSYEPVVLTSKVLPVGASRSKTMVASIQEGQRCGYRSDMSSSQLFDEAVSMLVTVLEDALIHKHKSIEPKSKAVYAESVLRIYIAQGKNYKIEAMIREGRHTSIKTDIAAGLMAKAEMYGALAMLHEYDNDERGSLEVYHCIGTGKYRQKGCDAVAESIKVLLSTLDEELIWEFTRWILKVDVDAGLAFFRDRKPTLSSQKVVQHLKSVNPALATDYLETMMDLEDPLDDDDEASMDQEHHTRLAMGYLDEIISLLDSGSKLSESSPGSEAGRLGKARKRLLEFLKSSRANYNVSKLLSKTKNAGVRTEFLYLCGRSGRHEEALQSILHDAKDSDEAEKYCLSFVNIKNETRKAFSILMNMYFAPDITTSSDLYREFGFNVLVKHAKYMDANVVINLLPDDTPLTTVNEFLAQALPNSAHNVRETSVRRSLSNMYNFQLQYQQVKIKAQHTLIDSDTTCMVCRKRIGDLVFAVYPNDTIAHYNCSNSNLSTCPVSGEQFDV